MRKSQVGEGSLVTGRLFTSAMPPSDVPATIGRQSPRGYSCESKYILVHLA